MIQYRKADTEYQKALTAKNLDSSEFIMLVLGYIESKIKFETNPLIIQPLAKVKQEYTNTNYAVAIQILLSICSSHTNIITPEMNNLIKSQISRLKDNPDESHNRRFFETKLAHHFNAAIKNDPHLFKIMDYLRESMLSIARSTVLPSKVESYEDVLKILASVCSFNDNIEMGLKALVPDYSRKDRKSKISERHKITKDFEPIASRNIGIMKSVAPNFYDEIASSNILDSIVDTFKVDTGKIGFSAEHPTVPFVNSISGTIFTLAALLKEYVSLEDFRLTLSKGLTAQGTPYTFIEKPQNEKYLRFNSQEEMNTAIRLINSKYGPKAYRITRAPNTIQIYNDIQNVLSKPCRGNLNLQNDINNIIKTFAVIYVTNGFHSLSEMTLVLSHPNIKKIFTNKNIQLNFEFPLEILNISTKDTIEYTKITCLRKAMQDELKDQKIQLKHVINQNQTIQPDPIENFSQRNLEACAWFRSKNTDIKNSDNLLFSALEDGFTNGSPVMFIDKPGQSFLVFKNKEQMEKAITLIDAKYGEKSRRIARIPNTIEIYGEVQKFINVQNIYKNQPNSFKI